MPRYHSTMRSRRWCFTLNNYTPQEEQDVLDLINNGALVTYGIFGREVGASGTPHLQGYLRMAKLYRLGAMRLLPGLQRAHLEPAKGNEESNIVYCSKDGDFSAGGKPFGGTAPPTKAVARYSSAMADVGCGMAWADFRSAYPDLAFKHHSAARAILLEQRRVDRPLPGRLRCWQRSALGHLATQDDRKICVYVDSAGGSGKSTLTRWLLRHFATYVCAGGKGADLQHAFTKNDYEYAVFDMCRTSEDGTKYWPYAFAESLKNGYFCTTKYDSGMYEFNPPKVVWFVNQEPERDKWSADRYCVHHLLGDCTTLEPEPEIVQDVDVVVGDPDDVDLDALINEMLA